MTISDEIWRDIPGFEGAYQVSDLGRVRSLDRAVAHRDGHRFIRGRVLRPSLKPAGYHRVDLRSVGRGSENAERVVAHVHTLVLLAFVGPRPEGLEIRHLNGNPGDSRLINLEYATHSRNLLDIKWHGGRANRHLTPRDVLDILRRRSGPNKTTRAALAREYRIRVNSVTNIWHGHTHKDIHLSHLNETGDA
jgi:NUMOD4 motif-containing protein/HNH endonuclease